MIVGFHHGALCDSYEEQANAQGFTFGDNAEWIEKVGYGLVCAHIHGCITDSEYDKILHRFQTKILLKNIEPQESEKVNCKSTKCENCINYNYCDYEPQESEE